LATLLALATAIAERNCLWLRQERSKIDDAPNSSPPNDALVRLGKLIMAGALPDWIIQEIGTIIAIWVDKPEMERNVAQSRIERL